METKIKDQIKDYEKEIVDNGTNLTIGLFYKLYELEDKYNQPALIEIISKKDYWESISKTLLTKGKFMDENNPEETEANKKKRKAFLDNKQNIEFESIKNEKYVSYGTETGFIDIYFEMRLHGDSIPVIIELKTKTRDHGNQLERYFKAIYKSTGKLPLCFYLTPEGKQPNKSSNAYTCLSYFDFVNSLPKNINFENDAEKTIITDYITTINYSRRETVKFDKERLKDNFLYYLAYFSQIKNAIEKKGIGVTCQIEYSHKNSDDMNFVTSEIKVNCTAKDFFSKIFFPSLVALRMVISAKDKNICLALEKRWNDIKKKYNRTVHLHNRYYLGIYIKEGNTCNFDDIKHLLQHWIDSNRKLAILGRQEVLADKEVDLQNIKKEMIRQKDEISLIAQDLSDWPMPILDNNIIFYKVSDVNSWANWILEDLERITDATN